ncbi:MAG TPA: hypothetical protein VET85_12500 [Stellaceae bacterium]|nr:hypothetical protein [Stellaceae bacterium]
MMDHDGNSKIVDIDMDRVVIDPDYRRRVLARLRDTGAASQDPGVAMAATTPAVRAAD